MRGHSLIETLFGLCLMGLMASVTVRFIQQSSGVVHETTAAIESRLSITKAALTISAQLSSLERSHLPGLVFISRGTSMQAPHGSSHPVTGVGPTSRPRPESDIISVIEVEPRYRGRIRQSRFIGNTVEVEVCGSPVQPRANQFRSHLAVGTSGACQMTAALTPGFGGCFTASGSVVRGMLHASPACPHASLLEYLPIIREFSVYVDKTGELRLVSHVGMHIVENQPIARGLRSLGIQQYIAPSGATLFSTTISASRARQHTFTFPGALTQSTLWNEILL